MPFLLRGAPCEELGLFLLSSLPVRLAEFLQRLLVLLIWLLAPHHCFQEAGSFRRVPAVLLVFHGTFLVSFGVVHVSWGRSLSDS